MYMNIITILLLQTLFCRIVKVMVCGVCSNASSHIVWTTSVFGRVMRLFRDCKQNWDHKRERYCQYLYLWCCTWDVWVCTCVHTRAETFDCYIHNHTYSTAQMLGVWQPLMCESLSLESRLCTCSNCHTPSFASQIAHSGIAFEWYRTPEGHEHLYLEGMIRLSTRKLW